MWHSSKGDRTLHGCEAFLVAAAIETMIDALFVHIDDPSGTEERPIAECQSGIDVFDQLSACQRIGLLHQLATHLLTPTMKPLKLSSMVEAGVAAVYVEIQDQIAIEIDWCCESDGIGRYGWRRMVCDAIEQANQDAIAIGEETFMIDPQVYDCSDKEEWEIVVDLLANDVLWDRDFEMEDIFLDEAPEVSKKRRRELGIDHDYYTDVAPDPFPDEAVGLVCETREILRGVSP